MIIKPIPWTAELFRRLDACEPLWCIMRWALLDQAAENQQAWFCGPLHQDGYGFDRHGVLLALFNDATHARAFLAQSGHDRYPSTRDYPIPLSALRFDVIQSNDGASWSSDVEYAIALRDVARARLLDRNQHVPSQLELAKSIKLRWSIDELSALFGAPEKLEGRPGLLSLPPPEPELPQLPQGEP